MKTIVYQHNLKRRYATKKEFWWADALDHKKKHGPFDSRAEAEDAARAAKITVKAEKRHGNS